MEQQQKFVYSPYALWTKRIRIDQPAVGVCVMSEIGRGRQ